MKSRPGQRSAVRQTVAGIFGATVTYAAYAPPVHADPCLADLQAAASGDLGYRVRGSSRCEGALRLYVHSSASLGLIGYHQGVLDLRTPTQPSLSLVVLAEAPPGPIVLRALSLTSQVRYQMDISNVSPGRPFDWPIDLLRQAAAAPQGSGADLKALGIIACSNRCADRPDTIYWPVAFAAPGGPSGAGLSLKLRSGVRADSVSVTVQPAKGVAAARSWSVANTVLTPNGVAAIDLPADLASGLYHLTVEARDAKTLEPLGALYATIFVPGGRR